ncbi:MAG: radical SAM protein [Spirochaetia bacterium]|nr:radical SAM protein [Spirochaetia bacterium]
MKRLSWIYRFWSDLGPYAYARTEDNVVILPPNQVYKTNSTGARLVEFLRAGGRFEDIPGMDEGRAAEVDSFFRDLERAARGQASSLDRVPYDFSFTRLPVLGEIAVTYRCNNRCLFCYAGCGGDDGLAKVQGGHELDTDGFKRVIDIFRDEAKLPFFSFTGGEPLVRKDIEELAAYAVSKGLRVNLVSNGTLADKARARSLVRSGLRTAQVSLEAPDAGTHDFLVGRRGAFAETVAGIRALMKAGVEVQTNSTATAKNLDALLELPAYVASLGIRRMSMNLFIPAGRGMTERDLSLSYADTGAFIDRVRKAALSAGVDFLWYSPMPMCVYNPIARGLGNKSCAACDGLLSVSPSGDVLPCSSWPEPVGNLLADGFRAVWFSERAAFLKDKRYAPDECRSCSLFTACQAACPLYWRVNGYDELKAAWKEKSAWN